MRHLLPRPKFTSHNQDFYQFSRSKKLIYTKRHLKVNLCIEFDENIASQIWDTHIHFHFRFSILQFRFSDFHRNLACSFVYLVLSIKFGLSIFFCVGDMAVRRFHPHTYIYQFSKTIFLVSGDLKTYESDETFISKFSKEYNASTN